MTAEVLDIQDLDGVGPVTANKLGAGKCISKDSMIFTSTGPTIASDLSLADSPFEIDSENRTTSGKALRKFLQNVPQPLEIKASGGFKVTCSAQHRFFTLNDEAQL